MWSIDTIAVREIPASMTAWLGELPAEVELGGEHELDLVLRFGEMEFVFDIKSTDAISRLELAYRHLRGYTKGRERAVPILVVPFMGPKARDFARSKRLSWMDLSGNADIRGPGIRILVEGKPNRFASPGRPSTAFSHKASRISRVLLTEPERWWRQRELAEVTGLSGGYISKVVRRLREDDLLDHADGGLRPRSTALLLDAWAQVYDFQKHDIARFHAVGRTGPKVTKSLARKLADQPSLKWAATGLSAAWLRSGHADHRLVTFYVSGPLLNPDELGLRPVERGENVWIVVPRDEGVFHRTADVEGVQCVSTVQVYLDLLSHPERASEAAARLRTHELGWSDP